MMNSASVWNHTALNGDSSCTEYVVCKSSSGWVSVPM
jgi:hypothetical protein